MPGGLGEDRRAPPGVATRQVRAPPKTRPFEFHGLRRSEDLNRSCNGSWGISARGNARSRTEAAGHSEDSRIPSRAAIGASPRKEAATLFLFQDNRPSNGKSNPQKTSRIKACPRWI